MSEYKSNPPAFPRAAAETKEFIDHGTSGMTLRDWFAGRVIAGMYANPSYDGMTINDQAAAAYEMADAMLKERAK